MSDCGITFHDAFYVMDRAAVDEANAALDITIEQQNENTDGE